jgi:hypothetical protein
MEESLFGLDGKMAALVGWEEGWFGRIGRRPLTRRGLVWFGWEELCHRLDNEGFV